MPANVHIIDRLSSIIAISFWWLQTLLLLRTQTQPGWKILLRPSITPYFFTLKRSPILWIINKTLSNLRVSLSDGDIFIGSAYLNVRLCYSKTAVEHYKLKSDTSIMVVVILCNFSKAVCMLLTCWNSRDFPLVIVGDTISSFLEDSDPTTKNMCVVYIPSII